ncbi:hypothetical protein DCAR_0727959 [Daucus carota subsp. sativus]|uniref:Bet v I/Major latex protein domain-containing protein n=1 Tax=Daucus carota subsp. sativus TaxID=79200 RepID=A0AAF0XIC8_DAUCS|nr:PREDICTED: major allergen Pyr c 1-like [Daucus carota subsp. sativus]WOH08518.1 hypothetical protein DCAR_0727959 [Daucus carota subsp. sativus]
MSVVTFSGNHDSPIAPARLFKASITDSKNSMPKIVPEHVKSIDTIEGSGGAGSVKQINLVQGGYLKLKVEALDESSFTYTYSIFEGEALTDKIEKMQFEIKFEPSSDGGSKCTMNTKCFPKGGAELNEDNCKAAKDKVLGLYKAVENYLVQNKDAYA